MRHYPATFSSSTTEKAKPLNRYTAMPLNGYTAKLL
jgi:hypothetical protein